MRTARSFSYMGGLEPPGVTVWLIYLFRSCHEIGAFGE